MSDTVQETLVDFVSRVMGGVSDKDGCSRATPAKFNGNFYVVNAVMAIEFTSGRSVNYREFGGNRNIILRDGDVNYYRKYPLDGVLSIMSQVNRDVCILDCPTVAKPGSCDDAWTVKETCSNCKGSGVVLGGSRQWIECDECFGDGTCDYLADGWDSPISIDRGFYAASNIWIISKLPNVKMGVTDSLNALCLNFVFDGGKGMLMPLMMNPSVSN